MIIYNPFLASVMSFFIIQETVSKHDIISFILGVLGITLLTDPFSNYKGLNDIIGITLALLSAISFNFGFISIRKVKKEIHSWQIVFFFMLVNIIFSPFCILAENSALQRHTFFDFYD